VKAHESADNLGSTNKSGNRTRNLLNRVPSLFRSRKDQQQFVPSDTINKSTLHSSSDDAETPSTPMVYKKVRVSMYNYGSPRVGNHAFKSLYDKMVPDSFRVVVDGDIVTGIPGYGYDHIGTEVLIDDVGAGSIIIDPSFVERRLRMHNKSSVSV
jgi:hypothetical protein